MSNDLPTEVLEQRNYYQRTAEQYDTMHVNTDDEHARALGAFIGLAEIIGPVGSVLDVGAGTGRAMMTLKRRLPEAKVVGVEPVAALREVGHGKGLPVESLVDGNALKLDYPDDAFDYVIETGILHHIATPAVAIREMARVAKRGIMISDVNNVAAGARPARYMKSAIKRMGLWPAFVWAQTRGKMYKQDDGDGVFYSFSVFDHVECFRQKFPMIHVMNSAAYEGANLFLNAGGVMVFATTKMVASA